MNNINKLASQHAARRTHQLIYSLGGLPLLGVGYLAGRFLAEAGVVTSLYPATILWSLLSYLLAAHLIYRSVHLPVVEQFSMLIINSLTPYLVLVLGFALMQERYSRGAVLTAALITMAWFWLVELRARKRQKLRLVHLDPESPQQLQQQLGAKHAGLTNHIDFVYWPEGDDTLPACNGALVSHGPGTAGQMQQLAQIKLHHIRLYSVAFL
ncbi:MAG TPA: sugar transferase, partial [Hydrogenophaga sp.]|nr:sugar transferase [Hydrogenophaga sp.]